MPLSTAMGLFVVPAFYLVADRIKLRLGRRRPSVAAAAATTGA